MSATSVFPAALSSAGANASVWARVRHVARRNPQIIVGSVIVLAFVFEGLKIPQRLKYNQHGTVMSLPLLSVKPLKRKDFPGMKSSKTFKQDAMPWS